MKHDPSNTNCDKVRYADMNDMNDPILCTCDDDAPAPSVAPVTQPQDRPIRGMRDDYPPRAMALLAEYRDASRELDTARRMLKPAQERWQRACDAFTEALISG